MGHAIGMHHTHQRQDRDDYVTIEWENITPGKKQNFYRMISTTDNAPYDYGSVLHYSVEVRADRTFSDDIYACICQTIKL